VQPEELALDEGDYDNWCPNCEHPRGACVCEPDANCVTTPDGGCIGGPCMHDVIRTEDENVFAFYVDKRRFESPERIVDGNRLRELAQIPARYNIHVENPHSTDDYLGDSQTIDLGGPLYRFFTVPQGFM
jgi:hypothetical protein